MNKGKTKTTIIAIVAIVVIVLCIGFFCWKLLGNKTEDETPQGEREAVFMLLILQNVIQKMNYILLLGYYKFPVYIAHTF